jgi:MFS family permease
MITTIPARTGRGRRARTADRHLYSGVPDASVPTPRRPGLALSSTLAVQAAATLSLTAPSIMAPAVAPALGVQPQHIGWFVGLAYLMAMFSGLAAGSRVASVGAIRMSRAALLACAVGLVSAAVATSRPQWLPLLALSALAIGLGYGMPNPAASMVLARHAPPNRRGLFFSIKQSGVPIGVGIAGLVVPPLLGAMPWTWALASLAAVCVALAAVLGPAGVLDTHAEPSDGPARGGARASASPLAAMVAPLRRVWREPGLRRLGVASLAFSMTQLCFVTFLVSYLKLEHGRSLAAAAAVLSVSQLLSVGCRVLWGQVADRWVSPLRLLAALGLAMAGASMLLGLLPPGSPPWTAMAAALACAATSMAWNGVYFAELAHRVRADELGAVTGGTQFLTFCGAMIGPPAFASLVGVTGGHGPTYALMAAAPAAVGVWLWAASMREG